MPRMEREGGKQEKTITEAVEKKFFLRKSKWLRVSDITEKSKEIMT